MKVGRTTQTTTLQTQAETRADLLANKWRLEVAPLNVALQQLQSLPRQLHGVEVGGLGVNHRAVNHADFWVLAGSLGQLPHLLSPQSKHNDVTGVWKQAHTVLVETGSHYWVVETG